MAGGWYVIGISGVTCGGKSSLSSALKASLPYPTTLINQDDYFLEAKHERHVIIPQLNHANWEILSSLNMDQLLSDVRGILEQKVNGPKVLIIEGFLVINYKPLLELMDQKYYFTLSQEECRARRSLRNYEPPDPPGYFDVCVWPMHLKHLAELSSLSHITMLDGAQEQHVTFQLVLSSLIRAIAENTK